MVGAAFVPLPTATVLAAMGGAPLRSSLGLLDRIWWVSSDGGDGEGSSKARAVADGPKGGGQSGEVGGRIWHPVGVPSMGSGASPARGPRSAEAGSATLTTTGWLQQRRQGGVASRRAVERQRGGRRDVMKRKGGGIQCSKRLAAMGSTMSRSGVLSTSPVETSDIGFIGTGRRVQASRWRAGHRDLGMSCSVEEDSGRPGGLTGSKPLSFHHPSFPSPIPIGSGEVSSANRQVRFQCRHSLRSGLQVNDLT